MSLRLLNFGFAAVFLLSTSVNAEVPDRLDEQPVTCSAPEACVSELNSALIRAMRNADSAGYRERYAHLAPVILRMFDFPGMTRVAARPFFDELSPQQRDALSDRLARLTISSFASEFDGYLDHHFTTPEAHDGPGGAVMVQTRLLSPYRQPFPLGYMLYKAEDGWRIYDIYLGNDLSLLSLRRSEYASIVARDGVGGLMNELDRRVAYLTPGHTSDEQNDSN